MLFRALPFTFSWDNQFFVLDEQKYDMVYITIEGRDGGWKLKKLLRQNSLMKSDLLK